MKNILLSVSLLIVFLLSAKQSNATHAAAADIYYEYVSPLTYKVHLVLYRDCQLVPATSGLGGTDQVIASSISCGITSLAFTVDTTGNNTKKIYGDLCPNIQNKCTDPNSIFPGYEEWHYSGIVVLPQACTDWRFDWQLCCRNNAINNIVGPGGQSLCVSAGLNNILRPINNSVFLSVKPIPYVCVNLPKTYLNGPLDPDFDSLNFVATVPLGCNPITWQGAPMNASTLNPFGNYAPAGYAVNSNTGTATFLPTNIGTYVIAFKCYEIIPNTTDTVGYVTRDVQLNVLNCNSAPPSATDTSQCYTPTNLVGGTLQPIPAPDCPYIIETCPGSPLSFDITSISQSISNLVLTYANNVSSCVGSTYTSNPIGGGSPVTGTFTWTPNGTQVGNHTLIITFLDSTCTGAQPIVLKSFAVFLIKVLPGVDAGPDLIYCIGADSIQLGVTAPPGVTQFLWTDINGNTVGIGITDINSQNPKCAPSVTTTYVVTALNPPPGIICKIKDTITVTLIPGAVLVNAGGPSEICLNDAITLNATVSPAQTAPTILWTPNNNLSSTTILNPTASPFGTTTYQLFYRDDNGCTYKRNHIVTVNGSRAILNAAVSVNPVCPELPFQLFTNPSSMPCGLSVLPCNSPAPVHKTVGTGNIQQSNYSPYYTALPNTYKTQMLFTVNELREAGIGAGNLRSIGWNVIGKGSDSMFHYRISMGCTAQNLLDQGSGFVSGVSQVFYDSALYTNPGWNEHVLQNAYFWDGVSNLIVEVCYDKILNSPNSDILESSNTVSTQIMQQTGGISACTQLAVTPLIGAVRPNTRFNICEVGSFTYSWSPSNTLDDATNINPNSSGITSTTNFVVTATAVSNPNCVSTDNIQVTVDNSNSVAATATPAILCGPGLTTLSAVPTGTAPIYYCGEENVPCATPFNSYLTSPLNVNIGSNFSNTPFNGNYAGGRTQMLFTVAELNAMGITKGRIDSFALFITDKTSFSTFNMNIKMGCTQLTQLTEFISPLKLKDVYQNISYTTVGPPIVGAGLGAWNMFKLASPFLWDGLNNLVVEMCFFNGQGLVINPDAVLNSTTAPDFRTFTGSSHFGGCDIPSVAGPYTTFPSNARPIFNFYVCDVPVKPWRFIWDPSDYVYDSTAASTTVYVKQSGYYHIKSIGGNGCIVKDSVLVTMSTHDIEATPYFDTLCLGDSYQAYCEGFGNAPSESFYWIDENGGTSGLSCTTCTNPIITPTASGVHYYYAIRTDTYGCADTAKLTVLVYPNPSISIINGDSVTIRYKEQINLIATGGQVYSWSPAWNSSNANDSSNIVSPSEPTMYYVYSINHLGCRYWDSIYVNIDYRDKLFIPTAFSPNGQGPNDLFRVANITFQAIQEFRVMNRWGQQVFSATDNRGWNGKYKGKDQDPGTYYYFIKVAFPDGPTKTYKGDVILVR